LLQAWLLTLIFTKLKWSCGAMKLGNGNYSYSIFYHHCQSVCLFVWTCPLFVCRCWVRPSLGPTWMRHVATCLISCWTSWTTLTS